MALLIAACSQTAGSPTPTLDTRHPFDLATALADLNKFKSVYTEFELDWQGTQNDSPVSGRLFMERVQTRAPNSQEIYAAVTLDQSSSLIAYVQTDGQSWFYHQGQDADWRPSDHRPLGDFFTDTFFTAESFFDLFDLQVESPDASTEQVGNVSGRTFSISEENFSSKGLEFQDAHGSVTVSAEGGYLIELDFTAEVVFLERGQLLDSGELAVSFHAPDTNSSLSIEPPLMTRRDIPLPADVILIDPTPVPLSRRDRSSPPAGYSLEFITQDSVLSVAQLFQTQMPDFGWAALSYNLPLVPNRSDDVASFQFQRRDERVDIVVEDQEGGAKVELRFVTKNKVESGLCEAASSHCDMLTWLNFPTAPDGDLKVIMSGGGFGQLVYETGCSSDLIQQFYTSVMPADGWSPAELADHTPQPDEIAMGFERGNEAAEIFIHTSQGVTQVEVQSSSPTLDIWEYPGPVDLQISKEFPLAPGTQLGRLLPGQLAYRTEHTIAHVVEFYRSELATAGWLAQMDALVDETSTILRYQKEQITATLLVRTVDNDESLVWVTLYRKKEGQP